MISKVFSLAGLWDLKDLGLSLECKSDSRESEYVYCLAQTSYFVQDKFLRKRFFLQRFQAE
jgi:hypothetical protein